MATTAADELENKRLEKAFSESDARLNQQFLMRRLEKERKAAEAERKKADAERAAAKEAKERKADPLYDERKAARAEAEKGAVTKMVGGVKVTEYPAVDEVERRPTAQIRGGGGGGGAGSLLREMNPQKLYKKGGKVRTASQRADGCCIRGKTRA
jgi:regulator of protease activity HflC (stomatin/prohibitin superfamily)